jgi:integration host factor subunit alpha
LTRADLADAVLRRVGLSRLESADIVDAVLTEIIDVIVSGEDLKLRSFGSFHVRSKNERPSRNPSTGAAATVSARRVVTFKPSGLPALSSPWSIRQCHLRSPVSGLPSCDALRGELTGLISIGDVVKYRLDQIESERKALHDYITKA